MIRGHPILLALTPARSPWATLFVSRGLGGPAAVGSMVLSAFTGVHAYRTILLIGGVGGVVASILFLLSDRTAARKDPVQCQV